MAAQATAHASYQLALITPDLNASAAELMERHGDRWPIEVYFEEAKHLAGVTHPTRRARSAPSGLQRESPSWGVAR